MVAREVYWRDVSGLARVCATGIMPTDLGVCVAKRLSANEMRSLVQEGIRDNDRLTYR